jgi:hypothetical protein
MRDEGECLASPAGTPAGRRLGRSFHAIRSEGQDLSAPIGSPGGERYCQVLGLCLIAASCIAVDVAKAWPTDPDVREDRPARQRGARLHVTSHQRWSQAPEPEAVSGRRAPR